ncbi:hypothetical protein PT015_12960 [Candidatus Mycobacterium wuenschmannii]|uniref:Secreted protein n=1 Tax=Candidatus Mycobacterium wuenschmannii TaxID=3027808 RepID=A0ABY8VQD8_9MYCO|nr:hypothetical protein [Candidatus Mycobacterium wuenschmannii]WIM85858.1 hypothetical protein PT015_12960 [Candidatus Mycobacterium wuenschmannii]
MIKKSVGITVFSLLAAASMAWLPVAAADNPNDCDQQPPEQVQQCKEKQAKGIVDDVLNNANRGNNQQPNSGQDRNKPLTGGAWMYVNGVLTCVPNGAVFRNNERLDSYIPPNGDPRC